MLNTCGEVILNINFGNCSYQGCFKVLNDDVPLILGM